jgi:hypothetical protein
MPFRYENIRREPERGTKKGSSNIRREPERGIKKGLKITAPASCGGFILRKRGTTAMNEEIKINQGFVYHIKDSYFEFAQDNMLMRNHEGGAYRPTYLCIKDDKTNLFWAIPMSRQVEKYKKVFDKDTEAYGNCVKILIARYGETDSAFLFQNMFPITGRYIDHIHTIGGNPVQVDSGVKEKVTQIFKENIRLHRRGVKVIFTDIDRLEKLMLDEIAECN